MKYLRDLLSEISSLVEDPESRSFYSSTKLKRLAAYGLLVEAEYEESLRSTPVSPDNNAEVMPQNVQFVPDLDLEFDFDFVPEKPVKRKYGRKNCKECGTRLKGRRRLFCSSSCAKKDWVKNNREKSRASQKKYLTKLRLVK